jgi:hypothetical protein
MYVLNHPNAGKRKTGKAGIAVFSFLGFGITQSLWANSCWLKEQRGNVLIWIIAKAQSALCLENFMCISSLGDCPS